VQSDGRTWANFDDVVNVEMSLRASLREGRERIVPLYIRDILNDAEDVSLWQPNAAIPLAIAVAEARRKGVPSSRTIGDAQSRLRSWFDTLPGGESTRFAYDDRQFDEHMRTLEERGVLRDGEFTSYLFEDWLLGLPKQMGDRDWKDLLQSSAIKRIRIPSPLQKVPDAEGGQATVWVDSKDNNKIAYRVTQLHNADDKLRFAETRDILERLKTRIAEGASGSSYIFKIYEVGLSADNDSEAVQVYRWVDGVDLSKRLGQLRGTYVADLGAKLSQALQYLHSLNIIHRDISPRNVIVAEEGGDPVIIDFGFARRLSQEVRSCFDSEFAAPEVRKTIATWTKAADVFSLGATLTKVLDPADHCDCLARVLKQCTDENPETRPDSSRLTKLFEEVVKELHVDGLKQSVWGSVQATCAADCAAIPWLRGLIEKFKGNIIGISLGCFQSQFERSREAANFLNQVLEAYSGRGPDQLSLGKVRDENAMTGKLLATDAIKLMHSIRKYHSHGQRGGKDRLAIRFNEPGDAAMLKSSIDAAGQIGAFVGVGSLEAIVRLFVEDRV
jgi:serine/threonine protein kinase